MFTSSSITIWCRMSLAWTGGNASCPLSLPPPSFLYDQSQQRSGNAHVQAVMLLKVLYSVLQMRAPVH